MPEDMPNWMASTITKIDKFSKRVGYVICWLSVPLIMAMTYEAFARRLFNAPTVWAYDMSRFFYGALFMIGSGYALSKGVHIRADFIYRNFKAKTQGIVDTSLYILFYFPGLLVFLYIFRNSNLGKAVGKNCRSKVGTHLSSSAQTHQGTGQEKPYCLLPASGYSNRLGLQVVQM